MADLDLVAIARAFTRAAMITASLSAGFAEAVALSAVFAEAIALPPPPTEKKRRACVLPKGARKAIRKNAEECFRIAIASLQACEGKSPTRPRSRPSSRSAR